MVQINGIFLGKNLENFSRTHSGGAALRPRESFGMAFAGRWSPPSKKFVICGLDNPVHLTLPGGNHRVFANLLQSRRSAIRKTQAASANKPKLREERGQGIVK